MKSLLLQYRNQISGRWKLILFFLGNYVRIKDREPYNSQIGKIKAFDGNFFTIELKNIKKTIYCMESQIEKIPKEFIKKNTIFYKISDENRIELKDQDLKLTCNCLSSNRYLRGLYALGKYYPKGMYEEEFESDYLTRHIIGIKNQNRNSAEEISRIYLYFIKKSKILTRIISIVDYIVFMPNVNFLNHVKYWGDILVKNLKKTDLSNYVYLAPEKKEDIKYYKYKKAWERAKIINGAFNIKKSYDVSKLKGKKCLILDDICTTGYQINELTNTLANKGIKEVYAFVIGKTKS